MMKKVFFILGLAAVSALSLDAQSFKETFDTNSMGWTEESGSRGEAVVKDGVMHIASKGGSIITQCYGGFDFQKNFEIRCTADVKKIDDDNWIGILIDYMDDYNFMMFGIDENYAYFRQMRDGAWVGQVKRPLKVKEKKGAKFNLAIRSTYNRIEFLVNDMLAVDLRYRTLISNGIGLYAGGETEVNFDDFEIIQ